MRIDAAELQRLHSKGIHLVGGQISGSGRVTVPQPTPPLSQPVRELAEGVKAMEPLMGWSFGPFMVPGQLCSKSNSRKIRLIPAQGKMMNGRFMPPRRAMRPLVTKSDEALAYVRQVISWVKTSYKQPPFEGDVVLHVLVYYQDRRRDLDIALLQDCLQEGTPKNPGAAVIKNDRQVKQIHAYHLIDKDRPRVVFYLQELKQPQIPSLLLNK